MNPDFKISIRAQRAKSLDLRRKVLLKNFFRNQNVYIHNAASAAFESFDFSKHQFIQSQEIIQESSENSPLITETDIEESDTNSTVKKLTAEVSEANAPFVFTNMMTALPDNTASDNKIDSINSDSPVGWSDSDICQTDVSSSSQEISVNCHVKRKRLFSSRRRTYFKRNYCNKSRTKITKRVSKEKLNNSPKKKRSFKTKFLKLLKPNLKSVKKRSTKSNDNLINKLECNDEKPQPAMKQISKGSSTKSVAIQTDGCHSLDICLNNSENHRLRLENKNLKNKVSFLLKLNVNDKADLCHDVSDLFESNQENKTGFKSSSYITRSRSVHQTSVEKSFHTYQKRHRRTRSAHFPRNRLLENNPLCSNHSITQPFKPMQSFICDDGRVTRKRRFSPPVTNDRAFDYHRTFVKRPRNLSLP